MGEQNGDKSKFLQGLANKLQEYRCAIPQLSPLRMTGRHCKACPVRNACLPDNYTHRASYIYRSLHQDEIDKIKHRQKNTLF